MITFIAHDKSSGVVCCGGFNRVINWSANHVKTSSSSVIVIIKCRPSEDGKVIIEIDKFGLREITKGRALSQRDVIKLSRRAMIDG